MPESKGWCCRADFAEWCNSPQNYLDAITAPGEKLAITNPRADATYEINPALPPHQQMIEFSSSLTGGVEWFVNGQKIAPQPDGRALWQLQPGKWEVTAVAATQTASADFAVESDP